MTQTVAPQALKEMLHDGVELALVDVREEGEFSERHLLFAVGLPLSRLELKVSALIPRKATRTVICDAGGDLAERGAEALRALGYTDLAILEGGVDAWEAGNYVVFSGINVPSKAFGEYVEHAYGTPSIGPEELKAMMDAGEKLVVLDSRPIDEFRNMSIPGAIDVPGAELAYRVHDLAPDAETTVIVNCAGRTRSIIGAQALINAGIPNRVVALRNGTMGWHLAGFELDRGQNRRYPEGTPKELTRALAVADRVAARFGVRVVETAELEAWRLQADERTLYLLDVRDPAEYGAGHLPGSRPAPGGQLVQALDYFIGVRGARVVLVDDTGVRATMTAHWLIQMGLDEVYMLRGGLDDASTLETGDDAPPMPEPEGPPAPQLTPSELQAVLEADDAVVLDVGYSKAYRKGHIPGSSWALRTRIKETGRALPQSGTLVIASSDGRLARLAVAEVRALTAAEVKVLEGGTDAWKAAGLALEADNTYPEDDACIDVWLRAYDRNSRVEEKMNEYLAWEIDLVNQIGADGDTRFRGAPS